MVVLEQNDCFTVPALQVTHCVTLSWSICFPDAEFLQVENGARLDPTVYSSFTIYDLSYALFLLCLQPAVIQLSSFSKGSHCLCGHRRRKSHFYLCSQFILKPVVEASKGKRLGLGKVGKKING